MFFVLDFLRKGHFFVLSKNKKKGSKVKTRYLWRKQPVYQLVLSRKHHVLNKLGSSSHISTSPCSSTLIIYNVTSHRQIYIWFKTERQVLTASFTPSCFMYENIKRISRYLPEAHSYFNAQNIKPGSPNIMQLQLHQFQTNLQHPQAKLSQLVTPVKVTYEHPQTLTTEPTGQHQAFSILTEKGKLSSALINTKLLELVIQ